MLLAYLIYLGFQYCILTGSSREVRNGVDAAVLNLSKRVCNVKVVPNASYTDVADSNGQISMTNINRVWGKAYLINANVDEMKLEGVITGRATGAGDLSYEMAEQINNDLRDSVTNKVTLDSLFSHLGDKRAVPLLGASKIDKGVKTTYPIALVDRGAESNLSYNPAGLPKGANPPQVCAGNETYMPGYQTLQANQRQFCFMPFRRGETPHLIADSIFNQNRADSHPISNFQTPIPNAFQGTGTAFGSGTSLAAAASAIVNPMQQYAMTIPHSFIRIRFANTAIWTIDGKRIKQTEYGAKPEKIWGIREYQLSDKKRVLNGWCVLGTEFSKPSILDVMNAVPADHTPAYTRLLQRAQEMEPEFNMGRLLGLLGKQKPDPEILEYYIFPRYSTPDLTDPRLDIAVKGKGAPEWLNEALAAEGGNKYVVSENPPLEDHENTTVYIMGGNPDCPKWSEISGTMYWQPGTGMSQCLGTLFVDRRTKVIYQPGTEGGGAGGGGGGGAGGGGGGT